MTPDEPAGETDDARRPSDLFEAPGDRLLLRAQLFGGEDLVGLRLAFGAHIVECRNELGIAGAAVGAVGEVIGDARVERVAVPAAEIAIEQPIVVDVRLALAHEIVFTTDTAAETVVMRWAEFARSVRPISSSPESSISR